MAVALFVAKKSDFHQIDGSQDVCFYFLKNFERIVSFAVLTVMR